MMAAVAYRDQSYAGFLPRASAKDRRGCAFRGLVFLPGALLFLAVFVRVTLSQIQASPDFHHADGAGSILHMHDDMWVRRARIFTAVCVRLVVAPPISSGTVKPSRSISFATCTISSSEG